MKFTISMPSESYLRLVKIYQNDGPLCPELDPGSTLGFLSRLLYEHKEAAKIVLDEHSPPKFIHVMFPECGICVMHNIRVDDDLCDGSESDDDESLISYNAELLASRVVSNPIFDKKDIRGYEGPGIIQFPPKKCNQGLPMKSLGMVRKVFALLKCSTMTPEIEQESNLSILEKWILDNGNPNDGLRLSPTKPIEWNGKYISSPSILTAIVKGMVIHGMCPDIRYIDETARDIYLSKLIAGTEENNTDGKMLLYSTQIEN